MNSNIEIKARTRDFLQQKELACKLTDTPEQLICQEDTFFNVIKGRLKLRMFSPSCGELIYYERDNISGPKQSNYSISKTDNPIKLKDMLSCALGIGGVVRKKRYLFIAGQTRIHLDDVEGLGYFIELEVVMQPEQTADQCLQIANLIMEKMQIREDDLIDVAYLDLLTRNSCKKEMWCRKSLSCEF